MLGSLSGLAHVEAQARAQLSGARIALIAAGRQEWESDDRDVREAIPGDVVNLALWQRAAGLLARDAALQTWLSALGQ